MIKIARKNKHLAKVIDRRGKAARIGAVALLASAVTGLASASITNRDSKESDKSINSQKSYTDTVAPATNTTDGKTTKTTAKDQNNNGIQINPNAQKEQNDSFQDSLKVETNTDLAQKKIDELLEKLEEFNLGDQVELDEGVNYTEDSLGRGNTGTVGKVQWRPSGNYIVNGISIVNPQTNEIVTYSFGNDENGNKDPEFNLNKYLEENVKKGMEVKFHIDKDGTKPTGWIDSSNIIKALEKSQEQQQDMNIDIRM